MDIKRANRPSNMVLYYSHMIGTLSNAKIEQLNMDMGMVFFMVLENERKTHPWIRPQIEFRSDRRFYAIFPLLYRVQTIDSKFELFYIS